MSKQSKKYIKPAIIFSILIIIFILSKSILIKYFENRGKDNLRDGEYQAAIANFTKVIKLTFNSNKAHKAFYDRGNAYFGLKNYSQATQDYSKAIQCYLALNLQSSSMQLAEYYNKRGLLYYMLNDYWRAIEDFSDVIKINPSFGQAYYNRSLAHFAFDMYPQACDDYFEALKWGLKFEDSYKEKLAVIIKKLGDEAFNRESYKDAAKYYNNLQKIDQNSMDYALKMRLHIAASLSSSSEIESSNEGTESLKTEIEPPKRKSCPIDNTWGITKEEAKKRIEGFKILNESDQQITFMAAVQELEGTELDCIHVFYFEDGKLVGKQTIRIGLEIDAEFQKNNNYPIELYERLKAYWIEKLGEPFLDEQLWSNEKYKKNEQQWYLALKNGHLSYETRWETEKSIILIALDFVDEMKRLTCQFNSYARSYYFKNFKKSVINNPEQSKKETRTTEKDLRSVARKEGEKSYQKIVNKNTKMRISAIRVINENQARNILQELNQKKYSFADAAGKYSNGPGNLNDGDLGYFAPGDMSKELDEVAIKLKVGEYSDVIKTRDGFWILMKTDEKH